MFSRPLIKIIRNSNALNVTGLIPKPQSLLLSRTFFTTQFKLESFPSLPSPPSFPTTTTLNSSGVSPTSSPLDSDHVPKQPIKHAIGKIERRLQITFTCTATIDQPEIEGVTPPEVIVEDIEVEEITCGHRSTHEFSKRSYDHGIVLIECPGCKNRHLIADNLQWFSDTPSPAHPKGLPMGGTKIHRTIEDLMKEKGEKVKWIEGGPNGGTWEMEV